MFSFRYTYCLIIQLCLFVGILAARLPQHRVQRALVETHDEIAPWDHNSVSIRAAGQWLRIMPLGASITYGQRGDGNSSNDLSQNGYRKPLRDKLRSRSYNVNMVGCQSTGQMADRQHEGHPGFLINDVNRTVACSIDQKPNLVLINAGTNDCIRANENGGLTFVQGAQGRMKAMIDNILSQVQDVTVILSTLLVNGNADANSNVNIVNADFRKLVSSYQSAGKKVQLADMNTGWITTADLPDGTHPVDAGYKKMAAIWDQAIVQVANKGWIKDPINTGKPDDDSASCPPRSSGFSAATQTQRGSGADDGTYAHASEGMGVVTSDTVHEKSSTATANLFLKNYHFAQLVNAGGADRGAETDELIRVLDNPISDVAGENMKFAFRLNNGGSWSSSWTAIDVKQSCSSAGVRWGDVNNDGLDDMICITSDGAMSVSINKGGNPPTFNYIGQVKSGEASQDRVRLGDMDGDGRIDYCVIRDSGTFYCWRNSGTSDTPVFEPLVGGVTFDANGMGDVAGMRLADMNGDFRSEFVQFSANGATRIFVNQRGTKDDGPRLKPHWVEASKAHAGGSSGTTVDNFKFGRVYGSGRADYIIVRDTSVKDSIGWKHTITFEIYKNTGSGGRKVKGDGVFYCDMYGRSHDDYLWVWEDGTVTLYENTGVAGDWKAHDTILSTGTNRKALQFADWNGDGLCDVLAVDKKTGAVDWWQNTWKIGQTVPTFAGRTQAIGANCNQGWGVGRYDLGVRFADIDGNGRADYLCLDPAGTTSAILNKETGFVNVGQVKYTIGKERADHRLVDLDSDGKADFIYLDKYTGDVRIFINQGQKPPTARAGTGDSSFTWVEQTGLWMGGVDRGANMFFAKMSNNTGRADFVRNLPATDIAYTYFNQPCKGGNDDDTSDLPLPTPPS